jgi:flagellar biosynthetic protein FliQ
MTPETAVDVVRQAFWITLVVGGPILVIGFVGGIVVSLAQIVTSMQDPAFSTVPRLFVFLASTVLLMPWMINRLMSYTRALLSGLEQFGR